MVYRQIAAARLRLGSVPKKGMEQKTLRPRTARIRAHNPAKRSSTARCPASHATGGKRHGPCAGSTGRSPSPRSWPAGAAPAASARRQPIAVTRSSAGRPHAPWLCLSSFQCLPLAIALDAEAPRILRDNLDLQDSRCMNGHRSNCLLHSEPQRNLESVETPRARCGQSGQGLLKRLRQEVRASGRCSRKR